MDVEEHAYEACITVLWCGEFQCLVVMQNSRSSSRELTLDKYMDVSLDMEEAEGFRRSRRSVLVLSTATCLQCHDFFQQGHGHFES